MPAGIAIHATIGTTTAAAPSLTLPSFGGSPQSPTVSQNAASGRRIVSRDLLCATLVRPGDVFDRHN
jgi:hypothetical protein